MEASKAQMAEASAEAARAINAIHGRLVPAVKQILDARESTEKTEAEKFGLVCVPSALTATLKQFLNSLKGERVGGKPDDQAAFNFE